MKIYIKKYLLQEGILGDNWGKIAIAGIAAAAHSGAMGPEAQKNIDQGGANFKGFMDKIGDKAGQMNNFYKKDIDAGKDHLNNGIDHVKEIGSNVINKSKEMTSNITNHNNNQTNISAPQNNNTNLSNVHPVTSNNTSNNDTRDISTKVSESGTKSFDAHNNHIDQEQFNNTSSQLSNHFGA